MNSQIKIFVCSDCGNETTVIADFDNLYMPGYCMKNNGSCQGSLKEKENTGFLDVCGNEILLHDLVVYCIDDSQLFRVQKYESGKYYLLGLVSGCRFSFDTICTEVEIEKP